jgi:hypothetical protein
MRSFFDPALIERWGTAFIREDKVDEALARLIPRVRITKGHYSYPGRAELRDLAWNHMDQNHRPMIHRTYGEAMRVSIGERTAFSLTRFGGWPAVIPVFDGYHKENGFYQVLCLFGLIVVINIIECNPAPGGTRMDIHWAIASHRLLRFLHPLLNRRLLRLNEIQNREDDEIRDRRVELRAAGYRFATDVPDFIKCNAMAHNVEYPPLAAPHSVTVADLPERRPHRIELPDRAYIVRRTGATLEVWPGVCPHEGAALAAGAIVGSMVKCRWHGLEFAARRLGPGDRPITLCGARLSLSDSKLNVEPAPRAQP